MKKLLIGLITVIITVCSVSAIMVFADEITPSTKVTAETQVTEPVFDSTAETQTDESVADTQINGTSDNQATWDEATWDEASWDDASLDTAVKKSALGGVSSYDYSGSGPDGQNNAGLFLLAGVMLISALIVIAFERKTTE